MTRGTYYHSLIWSNDPHNFKEQNKKISKCQKINKDSSSLMCITMHIIHSWHTFNFTGHISPKHIFIAITPSPSENFLIFPSPSYSFKNYHPLFLSCTTKIRVYVRFTLFFFFPLFSKTPQPIIKFP